MTSPHVRRLKVAELLKNAGVDNPPVPVAKIAQSLGVQVQQGPLPDELSGLLYQQKSANAPIIGVNSLHPQVRQRFTIAHEIGHFLFHKNSEIFVDRDFSVYFRKHKPSSAVDIKEIEANHFAAELLMPEEFLAHDLQGKHIDLANESLLLSLAERYKVSLQALVIRLNHLGYLQQFQ